MVRQLQPWHANLRKRQVRSPKIYLRDSGILHQLLGLDTAKAVLEHPRLAASWECFAIEQVLAAVEHDEAWFWATYQGAEIDLILRRGGTRGRDSEQASGNAPAVSVTSAPRTRP